MLTLPTIYHVTPITPDARLRALGGRHFMVSHYYPQQAHLMDEVAAGVIWENGAFAIHTEMLRLREKAGKKALTARERERLSFLEQPRDWRPFYAWLEEDDRLFKPGRWAIIPDVIAEGGQAQDALLLDWPFGRDRGAPVYHMGEPIDRCLRLLDEYPRICIGSTDDYWRIWLPGLHGKVLDPVWEARMAEIWAAIEKRHRDPVVHGLRMTAACHLFPFTSGDSSSAGQNGHRYKMPLFVGTDQEHAGTVAYADRLERRSRAAA